MCLSAFNVFLYTLFCHFFGNFFSHFKLTYFLILITFHKRIATCQNVIRFSSRIFPKNSYPRLFLLVSNRSLRTLSGSRVCLCLLSTNRKSFSMTDSSVASDFLKSLDIQSDFSSQVTLYSVMLIHHVTNSGYFLVCQVSDTGIRIYICGSKDLVRACSADSVYIS